MLEFHGFGSSAEQQMNYGSFEPQAERDGFLVVALQGQGEPRHFTLGPSENEQDDVEVVGDLIDRLATTRCIDTSSVYAAGMSNGGSLSAMLACRLSDRIAAFASVASVTWRPACLAAGTVPIIAFHGTADPMVPFGGGAVNCCGRPTVASVEETMGEWARHDDCTTGPIEEPVKGNVVVRTWSGCKPRGDVRLYVVNGGGHTWPGARPTGGFLGETTRDVDASEVIWQFFKGRRI